MTTGRSGTIGVVVGDIENPFFSAAVRGITDVAKTAGFTVILANSGEDVEAEKEAIAILLAKRVDGLIVTPSRARDTTHLMEIVQSGRPLAFLDRAIPELAVDTVTVNDREAAEAATGLLLAKGHRRIAYVTACDTPGHRFNSIEDINTASVRERIEGFLAACARADVPSPAASILLGANGRSETHRLALELLRSAERPTAVLASDSLIALEVFKVVRELGLRMPEDVSLITFHDADWTSVTTPPVTVVDQPVYRLGEEVAKLLVARLKGSSGPPRHVILPTTLIQRDSVTEI
jgi:LacI family transcriptional regulator